MTRCDSDIMEGITTCWISFCSLTNSALALFDSSKRAIFSSSSLIRSAYLIEDSTKFESAWWLCYFLIFIASKMDFSMGLSAEEDEVEVVSALSDELWEVPLSEEAFSMTPPFSSFGDYSSSSCVFSISFEFEAIAAPADSFNTVIDGDAAYFEIEGIVSIIVSVSESESFGSSSPCEGEGLEASEATTP